LGITGLEHLGIERRIILKFALKKLVVEMRYLRTIKGYTCYTMLRMKML
jgi:hypothetical protein